MISSKTLKLLAAEFAESMAPYATFVTLSLQTNVRDAA